MILMPTKVPLALDEAGAFKMLLIINRKGAG
jgi:hypothetical protein